MFRRRVMLAAVVLAGFGLVGCGSGDSVDADDPLVGAIADQILVEEQGDETGGVFGGDSATAECFAAEIVGAIGTDRLNELGFTTGSVPAELQADWSDDEIDILVDSLDGCVDIEAITKTALLADVSDQDQNCILGEIGNDFFLTVVRAGFEAGPDEAASQAAIERAYAPLIAAYETCGVSLFGGAAPSAGQDSPEAVVHAYYAGADANDPAAMFSLIVPDRREGVTVADWTGCMSDRLADIAGAELEFAHRGTSAADGSTFVEAEITLIEEGQGAVPSDDTETLTVSVVMEVTEIDGVWSVVGSDNDLLDSFSCL